MSDSENNDGLIPAGKSKRAAQAPADERDELIARLERTVAEERQKSAALRTSVDQLTFKLEVLEKSYAKQLADARVNGGGTREIANQQARLAEFREETMQLLAETRAVLERVTAERDELREQLERGGGQLQPGLAARDDGDSPAQEVTIDDLIADPVWQGERPPAASGHVDAQVHAQEEEPSEEMIAPDLVFTGNSDDDEKS